MKNRIAEYIEPPDLDAVEKKLLSQVQPFVAVKHHFDCGQHIYIREIWMPANSIILGHRHNTAHFNIVNQGRALVSMNGRTGEIKAPFLGMSDAGTRKALYIMEDMIWLTVHANPDNCDDVAILEERYITRSDVWLQHEAALEVRTFSIILNPSIS